MSENSSIPEGIDEMEAAFQMWWKASKYCQVVYPKSGWEQIARDGFSAAWNRRATASPVVTEQRGEEAGPGELGQFGAALLAAFSSSDEEVRWGDE